METKVSTDLQTCVVHVKTVEEFYEFSTMLGISTWFFTLSPFLSLIVGKAVDDRKTHKKTQKKWFFLSRFAKRHETGARTSCSAHAHSVVDRFSYRLALPKSVVTEFACTDHMVCACRSCRRQISVLSCACGFCRRQKLIPPKRPLLHRLSTNQNSLSRARPFCRFQHTFSVEKRQIRTTVSQHTQSSGLTAFTT